jgi:cyclophilin family peptidyl-prolyl cis-trans isomerase
MRPLNRNGHPISQLWQPLKRKLQGSPIHRVVKGGYIQGGDVVNGSGAGDPGYHIPDETYAVKHSAAGMLGMASTGQPHTAATQFYISLQPLNWLDGKMVAFGRAIGSRSKSLLPLNSFSLALAMHGSWSPVIGFYPSLVILLIVTIITLLIRVVTIVLLMTVV